MKKLLLIVILIASCASIYRPFNQHQNIDPSFSSYVDEIIRGSKGKIVRQDFRHITMAFVDEIGFDYGNIGVCWWTLTGGEIEIDRNAWAGKSEMARMSLIYHEVGHCLCNRMHTFTITRNSWYKNTLNALGDFLEAIGWAEKIGQFEGSSCPNSLMYASHISDSCLFLYYKEYMEEFYNKCNP